jgi:TRAP-type transport system periplasmic protein
MQKWGRQLLLSTVVPTLFLAATDGAAADIKERTIKVSYVTAKDHVFGLGVAKFAELVSQRSGGKLTVRGYPDGQLGAEVQSISAAQGGVLEMVVVSTAAAAGIVKGFALFDFPFLFESEKEADAVLDGPVGKSILDKATDRGVIGLCYWENGFRHTTNSKHPITKVEDFRGLKIRTIQNPVFVDTFNTLGANAAPMPFTEVYTALDTKTIDGQETPYNTIATSKFNEVQKYLSATKHIYGGAVVLVGKKFWDHLSADEKKILQTSAVEARDYERKVNRELDPKFLADLKAKGMVFNEVSPAELARMREKVKPVVDKFTKEIGEDLVKQAQAEIEKIRRQK